LTPDLQQAVAAARALRDAVATSRERRLLTLEGERGPGLAAALAIADALAPARATWITGQPPAGVNGALPPAKATALLGSECGLLIIDAHGGLDADVLGAAAGTLSGGGLLLLLCPPLADWPRRPDPQAARIAVHGNAADEVGKRFIARLARLLAASPAVLRCHQHAGRGAIGWPAERAGRPSSRLEAAPTRDAPVKAAPSREPGPAAPATHDQERAIDALCHLARSRSHRPLVLTADRGRGKSAALGIAAARLLAASPGTILVTAPRRAAAEALFAHADVARSSGTGHLRYLPPDALLQEHPAADLLLVDEAAGIPAPLLTGLLEHYARIAFATTVHGYEGTGRGFDVRFRAVLDRRTPGWRELRLDTPIRWATGDPLETLIDRVLLLDAEPAADDAVAALADGFEAGGLYCERLDRDWLAGDEPLLRQVFGLLVLGHYQTRPADLRLMLDAPNLDVFVARVSDGGGGMALTPDGSRRKAATADAAAEDIVVATALVAREGRLDAELLDPIFDGRRRPHGHLLPQTLSAHAGLHDAPRLAHARILRIAVHPGARRRGIGRRLMAAVADRARTGGLDLIGASFGATPGLVRFWRRCGLEPAHLGTHRNAASGAHAAVVLGALTAAGQDLVHQARRRLLPRLAVLLAGPLRNLEPAVTAALLAGAPDAGPAPNPAERREIGAFAGAHRSLDAARPALHRLLLHRLPAALEADRLTQPQIAALIACILQGQDPVDAAPRLGLSGRAAVERLLREAAGRLREDVEK